MIQRSRVKNHYSRFFDQAFSLFLENPQKVGFRQQRHIPAAALEFAGCLYLACFAWSADLPPVAVGYHQISRFVGQLWVEVSAGIDDELGCIIALQLLEPAGETNVFSIESVLLIE